MLGRCFKEKVFRICIYNIYIFDRRVAARKKEELRWFDALQIRYEFH